MQFETLKKKSEFSKLYFQGRRFRGKFLTIYMLDNNCKKIRVGISVGKKIGKAVIRNRIKRMIKEVLRKKKNYRNGLDLLVVAKKSAARATYQDIKSSIDNAIDSPAN